MDFDTSLHRQVRVNSISQGNTSELLDFVPRPMDDLLVEENVPLTFDVRLLPDHFLNQELGITNKVNMDSERRKEQELIPPILEEAPNVPPGAKAGDTTHENDKGVLDSPIQQNLIEKEEVNRSPNMEHDKEFLNGVDEVVEFSAGDSAKGAIVQVSNTEQLELAEEVTSDDCTEVSKSKTYGSVTFPEFIAFGKPGDPGENGNRFEFKRNSLTVEEEKKKDEDFKIHYFDEWISKKVAVHRYLPDDRPPACKKPADTSLPAVSVLIVFYNEAWTTLLRTIHSILDRTPEYLLMEIILLDDFSNLDHLKEPLEVYVQPLPKVRLYRAKERLGLIRARNAVSDLARAKVVVFLDSHVECFPGWLEPLLEPIHADSKAVTYPVIEYLNPMTFGVHMNNAVSHVGGIKLSALSFNWLYSRQPHGHDVSVNSPSPTMPGGLYAISRDFFRQLGKYDPGMDIWGAENLEISFKVWMCGGSLLLVSCSHVGHIFRKTNPALRNGGGLTPFKNSVRVAEVWMDQYKHFFYEKIAYSIPEFGNVSSRVQLRKSLQCHDFGWYLDNVYPELKAEMDVNSVYVGQIKNVETKMCIDRYTVRFLAAFLCNRDHSPNQFWTLSTSGHLVSGDKIIGVETKKDAGKVITAQVGVFREERLGKDVDITWVYDRRKRLMHKNTGMCLQMDSVLKQVLLKNCSSSIRQKWAITTREEFKEEYRTKDIPINWDQ
ncbi:hypothetical protein BsWGS_10279 [Bradybaena similaris]